MCYAVPGRIIKIDGENATIDYDGIKKKANISLVNNLKINDYVLVHAGFAIEKVNREKAEDSNNLVKEILSKNG